MLAAVALGALAAPLAHAQEVAECARAYEDAQVLRQDKRLLDARERLLVCVQDACPAAARADCNRWLVEVDANLPTVVPEVIDKSGKQRTDARVLVDGRLLAGQLDGGAVPVDPGKRIFRFLTPGMAPVERQVVVLEGQKNMKVTVSFAPAAAPALAPVAMREERPTPIAVYILGGAGVLALGSFAYFGVTAITRYDEASSTCAPDVNPHDPRGCADDDVDDIQVRRIAADVSLGVAIVALGAATVVYLTRPTLRVPLERRTARGPRLTTTSVSWSF